MNQHEENINATVSARRRLLRGLIASPAVLPLSAGAQTTAAASNLNCVRNGAGMTNPVNTTAELPWTASGDNWVRVKLWRVTKPGGSSSTGPFRYYVKGNDLFLISAGNVIATTAPTNGQWMLVLDGNPASGGYVPSGHSLGSVFTSGNAPEWSLSTFNNNTATSSYSPEQWAAVRFNNSGQISGVVYLSNDSSATSALAKTCWTSFSGFKAYPG